MALNFSTPYLLKSGKGSLVGRGRKIVRIAEYRYYRGERENNGEGSLTGERWAGRAKKELGRNS